MSAGKTHRVSPSAGSVTMTCRTAFAVVLKLMFVVLIVAVICGVAAAQSVSPVSLSEVEVRLRARRSVARATSRGGYETHWQFSKSLIVACRHSPSTFSKK
jgi:hypothetical protein